MSDLESSKTLDQLLAEADSFVSNAMDHDLPLWLRRRIWRALGPPALHGPGHRRRVALAHVTALKVLAFWDARYPTDQTPQRALAAIPALMEGALSATEAQKRWNASWEHIAELSYEEGNDQTASAAAFSAVQALKTAIEDELGLDAPAGDKAQDNSVEATDMDSTLFAATAVAGGPPGMWRQAPNVASSSGSGG
ncbi:hypothetical protein D7X12_09330 [Corallococcus sicarius]|uniref:Immunity protein Imm5 domain-containing protein n=1 Tax=Corallococcus sicarius TaxID=2316726 RepID=A0A3A8NMZ1_9BACT|nr:Imm5 family immunity protein [Corallococcus sicarius]RKH44869.1 hypothetical protein D7X12_09330 [Corallococcus sicarius]